MYFLKGSSGGVGVTGMTGSSGATGATGNTGSSGQIGSVGVQGLPGSMGATGTSGVQGYTGSSGQTGSTGYYCLITAQLKIFRLIDLLVKQFAPFNTFHPLFIVVFHFSKYSLWLVFVFLLFYFV